MELRYHLNWYIIHFTYQTRGNFNIAQLVELHKIFIRCECLTCEN